MNYSLEKNGFSATFTDFGGELTSFKRLSDDVKFAWTGDENFWHGNAPILFPNIGKLTNDTAVFDNKNYSLQKHGFARKSFFKLIDCGDDFVKFELKYNDTTLAQYPFKFLLSVKHKVTENGFITLYSVENLDNKPMPFCIGAHQGLCCPIYKDEKFEDYKLVFKQSETESSCKTFNEFMTNDTKITLENETTIPLSYDLFNEDVLVFRKTKSKEICLLNKSGKGIKFKYDGFNSLGIWTPSFKNCPFVCIEPWNGLPDETGFVGEFTEKSSCTVLEPNECFQAQYSVEIL